MRPTHILTCVLALAGSSVAAQSYEDALLSSGTLTIGTTGSSPPSTMYNDSAELIGIDVDLATKLAEDLGLEPEFVVLDWSGMLAGVQSGRFDMVASSVSRTAERVASADFHMSQAYIANGVGAAMHEDTTDITSWDDVCGKQFGIVKGAVQIEKVAEAYGDDCIGTPNEYPGWTELLLDLQNKRIDLLVGNYITPAYLITSTERPLRMLPESLGVSGNALVIQPDNPALAEAIDDLLTQYMEDGTLTEITKKWIGTALSLDDIGE
ncbi:substrate-binding periplasmic protein [Salipiger mucosus]|uniref:Amino acid ABC transporter, periplasmic amino acid-binding protein n=1 Tax=Salipiger mucosus DSM 16094 TaxID=1123237 RepID=S9QG16_9RHOB|nr:transporter substrate-binding domain-containing protein [Salipiger mucosus]EPX80376.1 amino acid ABC transporter, periplasmic amino acid-binding protein [Salipiger mucosus DSM 16094]